MKYVFIRDTWNVITYTCYYIKYDAQKQVYIYTINEQFFIIKLPSNSMLYSSNEQSLFIVKYNLLFCLFCNFLLHFIFIGFQCTSCQFFEQQLLVVSLHLPLLYLILLPHLHHISQEEEASCCPDCNVSILKCCIPSSLREDYLQSDFSNRN